ncbi:putative tRNA adenosine deaminase-associated protein [Nocardioides albertanoniae]|uniref:Putative tRNA adenosine deaminase-associated protein n=1 Tax=Nocardioides albertanoniae TaxID=1175486 RepID=A0A543A282_9ACTN|nr:tRNA adenosine deaminase-associated protein [Nocardioides albertanoniae]TQL66701.1 putative tRNA adenosine deaminase-associated protein [Nocardioides albertanoniae]
MSDQLEQIEGVDFAVAVYRESGAWVVRELAHDLLTDVETLTHALHRFPGDGGAIAMAAVDEDFFVIVRVSGAATKVLLSDVTAADEWEIAASALDVLGLPLPEEVEDDDAEPAGDLGILADFGMSAVDMGILLDDMYEDDLYPDETLSEIARAIGCGEAFDDAVGLMPA